MQGKKDPDIMLIGDIQDAFKNLIQPRGLIRIVVAMDRTQYEWIAIQL